MPVVAVISLIVLVALGRDRSALTSITGDERHLTYASSAASFVNGERSLLFLGSKRLGASALRASSRVLGGDLVAIATPDDSADGRSVLSEFRELAAELDIPLGVLTGNRDLAEFVRLVTPTSVLVVGWYRIIDEDLLALVPGGFAGIHGSLLPRYRGHAPLVWSLINGDSTAGATMFKFDRGVDDGDIIDQVAFDLGPDDTIADVLGRTEAATVEMIDRSLHAFASGAVTLTPQDHEYASYAGMRRPEDGLINWARPARGVHDFVRAQTRPYPGAFSLTSEGAVVRVWRTAVFPFDYSGVPGVVGHRVDGGVLVACGEGAVVVVDHSVDGADVHGHHVLRHGARLVTGDYS